MTSGLPPGDLLNKNASNDLIPPQLARISVISPASKRNAKVRIDFVHVPLCHHCAEEASRSTTHISVEVLVRRPLKRFLNGCRPRCFFEAQVTNGFSSHHANTRSAACVVLNALMAAAPVEAAGVCFVKHLHT